MLISEPKFLRKLMRSARLLLLLFVASVTMATAQTKPSGPVASAKPSTNLKRVPPTIKCVDPDSAVACKSFEQLVDARDEGIIFGIMGSPEDAGRHFAYVCPRRGIDTFTEVAFTVPERKQFKPFNMTDDEKTRRLFAGIWLGEDAAHPLSLAAVNKWYEDHRNGLLYSLGGVVGVTTYQDGQLADLQIDKGEWSRSGQAVGALHDEGYAEYDGGHYWIEKYNVIYAGGSPETDDPKNMHLHVDGRTIYAHYSFKNRNGGTVDYMLQIHRSTGRFTETFKAPDDRSDVVGTCMMFKY
jgi:hypothetical protein